MRYLLGSLACIGFSLFSPLAAECACKDCKCLTDKHCGCYQNQACQCQETRQACCTQTIESK